MTSNPPGSAPVDPATVSSLTEVIAAHTGALTVVPAAHLPLWLPDLTVPSGWDVRPIAEGAPLTRMLLRRLGGGDHWDACEVLNLYRVPAMVPETLVLDHADRSLRDSGADAIQTRRVDVPEHYGVTAATATGHLQVGSRQLRSQYTYYAVNTVNGAALVERSLVVVDEAYLALSGELQGLDDNLRHALLASIDRAPQAPAVRIDERPDHITTGQPTASVPSENGRPMSVVRLNFMPEFNFGDDAVLLTLDSDGVEEVRAAFDEALRMGSSQRTFDGVTHDFHIEPGAATIDLSPTHVHWRVDSAKTSEIIDGLTALNAPQRNERIAATGGGHYYVDIVAPADTLVLSRDEYVDVVYPWMSPTR